MPAAHFRVVSSARSGELLYERKHFVFGTASLQLMRDAVVRESSLPQGDLLRVRLPIEAPPGAARPEGHPKRSWNSARAHPGCEARIELGLLDAIDGRRELRPAPTAIGLATSLGLSKSSKLPWGSAVRCTTLRLKISRTSAFEGAIAVAYLPSSTSTLPSQPFALGRQRTRNRGVMGCVRCRFQASG